MINKKILVIEMIFIVGALLFVLFNSGPKIYGPVSGHVVEGDFDFEINGGRVIISFSPLFENFVVLKENEEIELLQPGIYYWKAKSLFFESEVRNFSIKEKTVLRFSNKTLSRNEVAKEIGGFVINVGEESPLHSPLRRASELDRTGASELEEIK